MLGEQWTVAKSMNKYDPSLAMAYQKINILKHKLNRLTYLFSVIIFLCIYLRDWVGTKSAFTAAIYLPTVPALNDNMVIIVEQLMESVSDKEEPKSSEKMCPSAALSTINFI
jgi:hypothetical protein